MANNFLLSTAWAKIRNDLYHIRGYQCERCDCKKGLQVHHLTYDRYGGDEEPEDLIILCGYHHRLEHGLVKPRVRKSFKKPAKTASVKASNKKKRKRVKRAIAVIESAAERTSIAKAKQRTAERIHRLRATG